MSGDIKARRTSANAKPKRQRRYDATRQPCTASTLTCYNVEKSKRLHVPQHKLQERMLPNADTGCVRGSSGYNVTWTNKQTKTIGRELLGTFDGDVNGLHGLARALKKVKQEIAGVWAS